jgi:aminoglycoside/choline kinase family phosphotransferase
LRDYRDGYLRYMPRVAALLAEALDQEPLLAPVRDCLWEILPYWQRVPPDDPVAVRARAGRS